MMLIALPIFSQEDTVKLPISIAKKVALDLIELDELREFTLVNNLIISKYKTSNILQQSTISDQINQIQLLQSSLKITEVQLTSEKKKKPGLFKQILMIVGAAGVGYIIGTL